MNELQEMPEEVETESPFKPMSESELAAVIQNEISRGIGGSISSDSTTEIDLSLNYYHGRLPGLTKARAKDKNASRYVSQDIMDAVESTIAEIMPAFTTDQVGIFPAEDDRDEDSARQETDIVNYLLMEEYDGYELIQTALRDCLLNRNCSAKVYWDEKVEVTYETFEDVPEMALAQILQPQSEDEEIEVVEQYVSEEADLEAQAYTNSQQHQMDMQGMQMAQQNPEMMQNPEAQQQMQQQGQIMQEAMLAGQDKYSIKIKRSKNVGKPVIMSLPPENVIVAGEHNKPGLQDCRFVAHEMVETVSNLIAAGYDPILINRLPDYNSSIETYSRGREPEEYDFDSAHDSTRLVQIFDCYIDIDFDGDGIAERRNVIMGGQSEILSNDETMYTCIVGGVTTVMPHMYKGISMFERVKDIQDAKTPIMRAIIDGVQLSSNPRIGVVTGMGANLDDLLTSRTGGIARTENANAFFQMPNPEVPQSSYQFLEFFDGIRRDRGGGAVDMASQMQQMSGDGQHSMERVASAMELNNALLAHTFGETFVRGLFIQLHHVLRENYEGLVTARVGGRFITSMPSEWKKRTGVQIHVGSSNSERARQANVMQNIVMTQVQLKEMGSIMYDEANHYAALVEMARLSGINNPEQYYVDVTSEEGQQKQQQQSQQQQEMKAKSDQMEAMMVESQVKIGDAELRKAEADMQANMVKMQNEGLKNEVAQLKTQLDALAKSEDLQLKREKQADDVALKLTELEIAANKDLSAQNEENKIILES